MKECYRVLNIGGIIRIVVPDLENLAKTYIDVLQKVKSGNREIHDMYNWIVLELYDQTVRNNIGGEMLEFLSSNQISTNKEILERCGPEVYDWLKNINNNNDNNYNTKIIPKVKISTLLIKNIIKSLKNPIKLREKIIKIILGKEYETLKIGRFRNSGEIHYWMYDEYSVSYLLSKIGFKQVVRRTPIDSYMPNWNEWNLDTEPDGTVYKPNSIYVEAIKDT